MEERKKEIIQTITDHFKDAVSNPYDGNRVDFTIPKQQIPAILFYLKDEMGFNHLSHISCIDWLEDKQFELVYILWSYTDRVKVFVHTRVDREQPVMDNIDMIWRQANTYEREIREMYGIRFAGLEAPEEFLLEDWQGPPPMRRDFDTYAYAMKTFWDRQEARSNAQDVRETIRRRTGEELPDFAKKYSR